MNPELPENIDPELVAKVRGSLLIELVDAIKHNRWEMGWGLVGERGANGGIIEVDRNIIPDAARFQPQQYYVIKEYADYLKCLPFNPDQSLSDPNTISIAKPWALQSGTETWTIEPDYKAYEEDAAQSSVITALNVGYTGMVDELEEDITFIDLNIDGRRADSFWAKIDGSSGGSGNKWDYDFTEVEFDGDSWTALENGRTGTAYNTLEANNDGSAVEGNSIDLSGQIFTDNSGLALKPVRGTPIVRMRIAQDSQPEASGGYYVFEYVNAIDGECD